jgi:hypothetical protein
MGIDLNRTFGPETGIRIEESNGRVFITLGEGAATLEIGAARCSELARQLAFASYQIQRAYHCPTIEVKRK